MFTFAWMSASTATVCHLANIATRTRKAVAFDPKAEQVVVDADANAMLRWKYREGNWVVPKEA